MQGYTALSISSAAQCVPASRPFHPVMKIPLLSDGNSRRVASELPATRDLIYEVRETSLVSNNGLTNGHANGGLNAEANGNTENGLINGGTNGLNNGRRFTTDNYTSRAGEPQRRDFARRLSEDGTDSRADQSHADIDQQNGNDRGCCETCHGLLMIDKSVQCEFNMADDGVDSSDYRGGMQMDTSPAPRETEVTVVNEWSPSSAGLNETVPVTAKTAPLNDALLKRIQPPTASDATDEAIKAWKKELADREGASTSAQQQQQQQKPPAQDDGPRHKLNNDGSESPDPDRNLNNTSTWRVRDRHRSSGSTSSDDEIEKISYLEMVGDGDKSDKPDGAGGRPTQPNSRPAKNERPEPEEEDGECAIRCLAYTLQCCECTIS